MGTGKHECTGMEKLRGADVYYCETVPQVQRGVEKLLEDKPVVISLDCEWRVFGSGYKPVALLQLASTRTCLLIHITNNRRKIPKCQVLRDLLANETILKVGCNIYGDLAKLQKDHGLKTGAWLNLKDAKEHTRLEFTPSRRWGLGYMGEECGFEPWKFGSVAISNWEQRRLSQKQRDYAALDAIIGCRVFWSMLRGRKIVKLPEGWLTTAKAAARHIKDFNKFLHLCGVHFGITKHSKVTRQGARMLEEGVPFLTLPEDVSPSKKACKPAAKSKCSSKKKTKSRKRARKCKRSSKRKARKTKRASKKKRARKTKA